MTLRFKITISFLFVSFVTVLAVGLTAWWMVMQDFRQSVEDQAFKNFEQDITAYIKQFGSWEAAHAAQPFSAFVRQNRHFRGRTQAYNPSNRPPSPQINRHTPPFRFLLVSKSGEVLQPTESYRRGEQVPNSVLKQGKPIIIDGNTVLYVVPQSDAILSKNDKVYLGYIEHALLVGLGIASMLALVLGLLLGHHLVTNLEALIKALRNIKANGEIAEPLPVKSRDEIGLLAETFNKMSQSLTQSHQELRELSIRDPLTTLYNRRYFEEQASNMFKLSQRYQQSLCVMLADIDFFKDVNDNYSHTVGDVVLQRTATILKEHIRESDLVARYGGEEFIVVFANTTMDKARERCELLRQRIESEPWSKIEAGLSITISLGLCDNRGNVSLSDMIKTADKHLYIAKDNGRNRLESAA